MQLVRRFLTDEAGTTAVEYAVMLALILLVCIVGVAAFGNSQDSYWGRINGQMNDHGIGP
jgi:pilus assembly protein Flp/PilA